MAIVTTDDKHYTNIAQAIRVKTGMPTTYAPEELPGGVEEVYQAGHQAGVDSIPLDQVTAGATDVVSGKTIVAADGSVVEGTADLLAVARSIVNRTITAYHDEQITTVGQQVFRGCNKLKTVVLPNVITVDGSAFYGCSQLANVNLLNAKTIGAYAFYYCSNLAQIDLPSAEKIEVNCFQLTAVKVIVLRSNNVCALSNVNAFTSTPFASGGTGGKVYVPSALIESYKAATNWSTLVGYGNCEFVAIEGSAYE